MALPLRDPHVLWGWWMPPHLPDTGGAVESVTGCRSPHMTNNLRP